MFTRRKADDSETDITTDTNNQPQDTVSSLTWAPTTNSEDYYNLACASWDSKIRIYQLEKDLSNKDDQTLHHQINIDLQHPAITVDWSQDKSIIYAGTIKNQILALDVESQKYIEVGNHDGPVKDIYWVDDLNLLCSLSYDKTMRFWDLRQKGEAGCLNLSHKVYCSDLTYPKLILGLSNQQLLFLDLKNIQSYTENNLEFVDSQAGKDSQLTCLAYMKGQDVLGVCTINGRTNLSYLKENNKFENILTFKCQKIDQGNDKSDLYPVHASGFNSRSNQFYFTAGGNGFISFWDFHKKDLIKSFQFQTNPVSQVKISQDGYWMAYALGYDWSMGLEGMFKYQPKLCVHYIEEDELKRQ